MLNNFNPKSAVRVIATRITDIIKIEGTSKILPIALEIPPFNPTPNPNREAVTPILTGNIFKTVPATIGTHRRFVLNIIITGIINI